MPRSEIKQTIYQDLLSATALVGILGPVVPNNARIYNTHPMTTPQLSGVEADEGWLVFYEPDTVVYWDTVQQHAYFDFVTTGTRLSIGDDVIDVLDQLYHWKLAGQNGRLFGEWRVIRSQRTWCGEVYDSSRKLYIKTARYKFYISGVRTVTV